MSATLRINTFLRAASERFNTHDSDIAHLLSGAMVQSYSEAPRLPATTVPACANLPGFLRCSSDGLMSSLADCVNDLHWRQAGFGRLPGVIQQSIAVVEILGPGGLFHRHDLRFGLLIQCAGVQYPRHQHAAEELYLVLRGTADWTADASVPTPQAPGTFVHHTSLQPHSMTTRAEPLLALWGWTGDIESSSYSI